MRGKKAKAVRRLVYGKELSPRHRKYARLKSGQIIADERRRMYQGVKWHV